MNLNFDYLQHHPGINGVEFHIKWKVEADGGGDDDGTDFGFAIGGGIGFMEKFEGVAMYKSFDDAEYVTLTLGFNFGL